MRDGYKAAAIVAVPLALLGAAYYWLMELKQDYAYGDDLCLLNSPLEAHTILVIDMTDPWTAGQKEFLSVRADQLKRELRAFERFSIYGITDAHITLPQPLMSLCNPGDPQSVNFLVRTPARVQADFEERFRAPLRRLVAGLDRTRSAKRTPIIETLRALAITDEFDEEIERRLVIFSDMLQNTDYSQINADADLDYFEVFEASGFANDLPDLNDVQVEVLYIPSAKYEKRQTPEHLQFWKKFFEDSGAKADIELVGMQQDG